MSHLLSIEKLLFVFSNLIIGVDAMRISARPLSGTPDATSLKRRLIRARTPNAHVRIDLRAPMQPPMRP